MFFDTHAHLDDERFDGDREQVIGDLRRSGVHLVMSIGANLASSRSAVHLAQQYPGLIYASVGVHPHDASEMNDGVLAKLPALSHEPCVKAWGEIGLDYHYDLSPRPVQRDAFALQLETAKALNLPVVLHVREAHGDALDILRAHRSNLPTGVVHCYSGSRESAREYMDMGFFISFTGSVTFKNATRLAEVSDSIPLDRLMVETDSPYMAPVPRRGERNDPRNVRLVAEFLASRREIAVETLAHTTMENGKRLFRIAD